MAKKSMKAALSSSLKEENKTVKTRFEKAESLLAGQEIKEGDLESATNDKESGERKRVVRDSFTLPTEDYELIALLKQRCLDAAYSATKSEVIRAGLHALNEMSDQELIQVFSELTKVKTGRPSNKI